MALFNMTIRSLASHKTWHAWWLQFRKDKSPEGVLGRMLAFLAVVTLITAWFSETFFFPDEHFQILEYMATKLGLTSPADLPWEYAAKARPFLQPFLYYLIAKPLMILGVKDAFDLMFVLRLVTGVFSLGVLAIFARFMLEEFQCESERFAYAKLLPFMGFLPYLFVRTASETAAAAFFTLAVVVAVRGARANSWYQLAWAGLLGGIAFECRFQAAFLVLGLMAWLAIEARLQWAKLAGFGVAGLAVLALSALIDHWGYGVWCFPPWNYVDVNLIQGIASKTFGASPWYAYFYLEPGTIFAPVTAVLMIAMVVACLRNSRHVVTWVTVPFFIGHCLIGHKEERFLFPLVIVATAYPILAFAPGRPFPFFDRLWAWRRSVAAKLVGWSAVAAMLFLAVYPFGLRPHMKMAKYLYHHFHNGLQAFSFDPDRFDNYPMVRPKPYRIDILFDRQDLQAQLAKGPVYLLTAAPALPAEAQGFHATLLYSEFAFAKSPAAARKASEILCGYANLKRTTPIHPPRLKFLTLFKIENGPARGDITPCTPRWN